MEFRLLGSMELIVEGRQVKLGSPKERTLLAILLCAARAPVPMDTLLDRLWDGDPPPSGSVTVQSYLSRLRHRLRAEVGDLVRLNSSTRAYRLEVDADTVDLLRFRHLHSQARELARSGEAERAVDRLREAESLWRGEALSDFGNAWAATLRHRLAEERRAAQEQRVHLELGLGRHSELVGELVELVARQPIAEPVVLDLMLALFRSGRQGDSLAVYRQARTRLRDELGLAPGPALDQLHQRVLQSDPTLHAPTPTLEPAAALDPTAQPAVPRHGPDNLPRDIPDFTGRKGELAILLSAAAPSSALPLIVIHGMPGCGKTALAVHAAHQLRASYPDGVLYVDLHRHGREAAAEPADTLTTLLTLVGTPAGSMPGDQDGRSSLWREQMSHRRALLVLDDVQDAAQVRPLLPGNSGCCVIVTSRHWLAELEGSRLIPLDVLSETEAVELFTRIVGRSRSKDVTGVRHVVHLCGRLALAIQLTANRFRHRTAWDVSDLADQLRQLSAQPGGHGTLKTINSSFDLCYKELGAAERRLLRLLTLHPGPDLTLRTATALDGRGFASVRRSLDELLDGHMLEESMKDRYFFHDLVRSFMHQAALREETAVALRSSLSRLLDYYLGVADAADRLAHPGRRRLKIPVSGQSELFARFSGADEAEAWLDVERSNLLAVAQAAVDNSHEHARFFPHVLAKSLYNWGTWQIADSLHEAAYDAWGDRGDPVARAQILVDRASALWSLGSHAEALHHGTKALDLSRSQADQAGQAQALFQVARVKLISDHPQEALRDLDEALALHRQLGNARGEAEVSNLMGIALGQSGRFHESLARFQSMYRLEQSIGDKHGQAWALNNIGRTYTQLERHEAALKCYEESLSLVRRIGGRQELGNLYENLGNSLRETGDHTQALAYLNRAVETFRDLRDPRSESDSLISMGLTFQGLQRYEDARTTFALAEQISTRTNNHHSRQKALLGIASTHRAAGDHLAALAADRAALELARQLGTALEGAQAIEGLADTVLKLHDIDTATTFYTRALGLFDRMGVPHAGLLRSRLEQLRATG